MKKERLIVGDVCILWQSNFPLDFVRILGITPGAGDKPGWSSVILSRNFGHITVPFGWLLDEDHLHQEKFMLNGIPYYLEIYSRIQPSANVENEVVKEASIINDGSNTLF